MNIKLARSAIVVLAPRFCDFICLMEFTFSSAVIPLSLQILERCGEILRLLGSSNAGNMTSHGSTCLYLQTSCLQFVVHFCSNKQVCGSKMLDFGFYVMLQVA